MAQFKDGIVGLEDGDVGMIFNDEGVSLFFSGPPEQVKDEMAPHMHRALSSVLMFGGYNMRFKAIEGMLSKAFADLTEEDVERIVGGIQWKSSEGRIWGE